MEDKRNSYRSLFERFPQPNTTQKITIFELVDKCVLTRLRLMENVCPPGEFVTWHVTSRSTFLKESDSADSKTTSGSVRLKKLDMKMNHCISLVPHGASVMIGHKNWVAAKSRKVNKNISFPWHVKTHSRNWTILPLFKIIWRHSGNTFKIPQKDFHEAQLTLW